MGSVLPDIDTCGAEQALTRLLTRQHRMSMGGVWTSKGRESRFFAAGCSDVCSADKADLNDLGAKGCYWENNDRIERHYSASKYCFF
jgi:hypothetical protein